MRRSFLFVLLPLTLLAACNRANEGADIAPAAATIAAPATVAPALPATVEQPVATADSVAPGEHTTFDAKAFAGSFSDEHMSVVFTADGAYTLSSHAADASKGTWTLEPDGRHLRLDPESKGEDDRVYELVDNDQLRAANGTQVLRRGGSAQ
jgi:copper homeostasis protein (lipoprotein)